MANATPPVTPAVASPTEDHHVVETTLRAGEGQTIHDVIRDSTDLENALEIVADPEANTARVLRFHPGPAPKDHAAAVVCGCASADGAKS